MRRRPLLKFCSPDFERCHLPGGIAGPAFQVYMIRSKYIYNIYYFCNNSSNVSGFWQARKRFAVKLCPQAKGKIL